MDLLQIVSDARSVVTLICMLTFIGIVIWAYSARRKNDFEEAAMLARIYRPSKTAMQSGRAKSAEWLLEFEPNDARRPDPLMGWAGSGDMQQQVTLKFASREEALAYAEKHGIAAVVHAVPPRRLKLQAYADNFR